MIRAVLLSGFASALLLTPVTAAGPAVAGALERPTFVLPANDGYGVADCLSLGGECAFQVANAWCAAQGYHHVSDVKPVLPAGNASGRPAIAVTCDP